MLPKRKVGKTDIEVSILVLGGHSVSDLPFKTMPTDDEAVELFQFLYEQGLTHFDCTWKRERKRYNLLLDKAGLKGKLLPIVWHGWHNRVEQNADDIVESFKLMLDELGCEKAGMIIMNQWDHKEEHLVYYRDRDRSKSFVNWFIEGFLRVKSDGLTDAIGWAVEPGPLNRKFLSEIWTQIDFIAPFWNFRDRRNQHLIEFAREKGLGVYDIAPFRRGDDSMFRFPGIRAEELVGPWLRWIFQEPSVFGTAVSLPNFAEAKMVVEALTDLSMTSEDFAYLNDLNIGIEWPLQ